MEAKGVGNRIFWSFATMRPDAVGIATLCRVSAKPLQRLCKGFAKCKSATAAREPNRYKASKNRQIRACRIGFSMQKRKEFEVWRRVTRCRVVMARWRFERAGCSEMSFFGLYIGLLFEVIQDAFLGVRGSGYRGCAEGHDFSIWRQQKDAVAFVRFGALVAHFPDPVVVACLDKECRAL